MLEETKGTEQITSIPTNLEEKPVKSKDPKKVAAGKALAKKNKEARDALKSRKEEKDADMIPLSFSDVSSGLQMTAGVIGSCFALYHAYNFLYPKEEHEIIEEPKKVEEPKVVEEPKKEKKKKREAMIDMD